jgi:chromosome partitioning protein
MLVCFANTKGGVGKSTLAAHLAVWLFDRGRSVALLDCDQQRSSSTWIREAEQGITVATADSPEEVAAAAARLSGSHEFVVGDSPGGLDDRSRTLLLVADLVLFPITPSILDMRSVAQASAVLKYAQSINRGRPLGKLVLNRIRTRDTISRELVADAPSLGLDVAATVVRDLQALRDAAQQGTVVTRRPDRNRNAADDLDSLFQEVLTPYLSSADRVENA